MSTKPLVKVVDSFGVREFFSRYEKQLGTYLVAGDKGFRRTIREKSVNRPSLALTGYLEHFAHKRLQLFGMGEMGYLREMPHERQLRLLEAIADKGIPCMVVSRNLAPTKAMIQVAEERKIPLYRTPLSTKDFTTTCTIFLELVFAETVTLHGVMMDIRGMGVLIRGESGIGKSECAIGLLNRGHSLVADDMVYVRLLNEQELVATSSDMARGYIECRGLGIVNVVQLYGVRALCREKRVDLVVTFVEWTQALDHDRSGLDQQCFEILGQKTPHIIIPISPGRDLAQLAEAAAMVQLLRRDGHDPAIEFNERQKAFILQQQNVAAKTSQDKEEDPTGNPDEEDS